jgi:hypothetical protein
MNKKILGLKIISIILILWPFIDNNYSILRQVSVLIGIVLFLISLIKEKKSKLVLIFTTILLLICSFTFDFLLVRFLKFTPIFSYEINSSNNMSTYNNLIYRVYNCNGENILDLGYKKNYQCSFALPEENINSFLANSSKYKNKFVNINGKISAISGSSQISMQAYETLENSINGQVLFSENITLIINNNGNLDKIEDLKIYDTINIIGRISKIKNNGQNKEIYMEDAKIISRNTFDSYTINVVQNKQCESDLKLISKTNEYNYYSSCLQSIYVVYDEDNRYDLDYVLTDKRMTFEELTKNITKESNEVGDLYKYDSFNLVKCANSNNIIIGTKKLDLKTNYCNSFEIIDNISDEGI